MLRNTKLLSLLLIISGFIFSCDDNEDTVTPEKSNSEAILEDMVFMNAEINSAMGIGFSAFGSVGGRLAEDDFFCGEISFNFESNFEVIIDYGEGCEGPDGKIRSGKISFSTNGQEEEDLFEFTLTYDNLFVNGNLINGSITSSGFTQNSDGNYQYTITASNISVKFDEDDSTLSYSGTHTYEWIKGFESEDPFAVEYRITGSTSGTTRRGVQYSSEITTPYIVKTVCYAEGNFYPTTGVSSVTPVGSPNFSVDFGSGTCDKKATIEIGSETIEVNLP
ncbi:MAG: hypothetical protein AAGI07_00725 [Bacteroidota bacterium]